MQDGLCPWCHTPLDGQVHTGLPAFDFLLSKFPDPDYPDADRYCSKRCLAERVKSLFDRRKLLVQTGEVFAGIAIGEPEKWPRFTAEVPPEMAALLDGIHRRRLGVDASSASRAGIVRAGLRLYLETYGEVQEPAIDGEVEEASPELPDRAAS